MMLMLMHRGLRLSQALLRRSERFATVFGQVSLLWVVSLWFLEDMDIDEDLSQRTYCVR
jgi:hypothetical protein